MMLEFSPSGLARHKAMVVKHVGSDGNDIKNFRTPYVGYDHTNATRIVCHEVKLIYFTRRITDGTGRETHPQSQG